MEIWVGFVTIVAVIVLALVVYKLVPNSKKVAPSGSLESTEQGAHLTYSVLFNTPEPKPLNPNTLSRELVEPLHLTSNSTRSSRVMDLTEVVIKAAEIQALPPPYNTNNQLEIETCQTQDNSQGVYDFTEDFRIRNTMKIITC
ncbi:hypothetical protein CONCODRAFT_9319 [Conidiobolus coronatus NRRL 28638]|uniref:Uncharacterized protein n=1 Tax=Conidiobolus coronatus (strain ATCC 28846 / CBS 209.66 / NRRL 28638) TaxID=796925 RepID=A0A137P0R4_CONC2|nr:hypothetical protein CONCODRAFT_9319 [Conidiobolus coronatus NRRL 28638]|eukprot:KXN68429.1 hypothetical protein CONCODRAFT_9319 [Conidiobolus coronatus NRRL 28638]